MNLRRRIEESFEWMEVTEEIKDSGSWTVPSGCVEMDAFAVGGGAGGGPIESGGGGGGYTTTLYGIAVTPGESLVVEIGQGGVGGVVDVSGLGGSSQMKRGNTVLINAGGGQTGVVSSSTSGRAGGAGGSGGGGGCHGIDGIGGVGGSNGGAGGASNKSSPGGKGQGTSTVCPFNGVLYAGGGAGMRWNGTAVIAGGAGGGGDGSGWVGGIAATNGTPNTGGGGGNAGGAGGSGIIVLHYFKYKVSG
jgi:hypothetical protein